MTDRTEAPSGSIRVMAGLYFVMFMIPVGLHAWRPLLRFPAYGTDFVKTMLTDALFGFIVAMLVCAVSFVVARCTRVFDELARGIAQTLGPVTVSEVFFVSVFSALGEEFFFRGMIQAWVGLIPASVAFGLLHLGPSRKYWPWTAFAVVMGFLLGGLYDWRANLLLPVVVHFTVNFVNLLWVRPAQDAAKA